MNLKPILLLLALAGVAALHAPVRGDGASTPLPGELLVGIRADRDDESVSGRLAVAADAAVGYQRALHAYHLRLRPGASPAAAVARLRRLGEVADVAPNHPLQVYATANDPGFASFP